MNRRESKFKTYLNLIMAEKDFMSKTMEPIIIMEILILILK